MEWDILTSVPVQRYVKNVYQKNKQNKKIFCYFVVKGFLNSSGLCINILFALKPTQGFSLKPQCIKLNKTQQ